VSFLFAQRLKSLRAEKGINQNELAQAMNVKQGTIGNWETQKRAPDSEMLIRLADYFDVSTDYLLGKESSELIFLTRHLSSIPEEDRSFLINNFNNTIDVYLKSKGIKT